MKNQYQILTSVKIGTKIITCEKFRVSKLTRVKNRYQIIRHAKYWNHIITHMKNWYLIVTDVSAITVKNWNRLQNAADLGVFYQCEEYACTLSIWSLTSCVIFTHSYLGACRIASSPAKVSSYSIYDSESQPLV